MARCLLLLICAVLASCASAPPPAPPTAVFEDSLFAPPDEPVDASRLFALDDSMRHYLRSEIAVAMRHDGILHGLFDALYRRDLLQLDYDAGTTRNAAQAFADRKGNCLSLVIMTAAFARELGLDVDYQAVTVEGTWSRSQDLLFLSGHVNLTISQGVLKRTAGYDSASMLTIDFLPSQEAEHLGAHPITEETIVAMYMNNRAAEALARGRVDTAYWWARAAINTAPDFGSAYNTLGVIYLRHGDLLPAQQVLSSILQRDPDQAQALNNLSIVFDRLGRAEEARGLRTHLARLEPDPPYRYFFEGKAAMDRGDYNLARHWFKKEVQRAGYNSEFHFWLGLADLHLGALEEARREMTVALENSTNHDDFALYSGKLAYLRTHGAPVAQ